VNKNLKDNNNNTNIIIITYNLQKEYMRSTIIIEVNINVHNNTKSKF